ncbi:Purine nucleoside phosphorylase [Marinobacterium lacunae]|uniref:Purine nucleoside phosphorylase n=1 Tax=Marinobacterium lacunae TaxID=1232683 RepID=A0A081FU72_9GAMM|nr:DUF523 domain-containing protein [Marinobacterium lacunae]KEA62077.1 Purine nucleoside phosphorylase [Marinobacterium lacunae]MBR9883554.1 DUF523 domain-containing protein [Oceanospirillales bacterium]
MDKILVSACLLGAQVRYDGGHCLIEHPTIARWKSEGRLISVCPEVLGGLPTPRPPAEIQSRFPILVSTGDGRDFTPQYLAGAELTADIAREHNCVCALMKARSPSCGNRTTYDGNFSGTEVNAPGVSAHELIRGGIPVFNENEIEELIEFMSSRLADTASPPSAQSDNYRHGSTCG